MAQINPTYFQANEILLKMLADLGDQVKVVDISKSICSETSCFVKVKNKMLYKDEDHLSVTGNSIVWPLMEDAIKKVNQ